MLTFVGIYQNTNVDNQDSTPASMQANSRPYLMVVLMYVCIISCTHTFTASNRQSCKIQHSVQANARYNSILAGGQLVNKQ